MYPVAHFFSVYFQKIYIFRHENDNQNVCVRGKRVERYSGEYCSTEHFYKQWKREEFEFSTCNYYRLYFFFSPVRNVLPLGTMKNKIQKEGRGEKKNSKFVHELYSNRVVGPMDHGIRHLLLLPSPLFLSPCYPSLDSLNKKEQKTPFAPIRG